jgi:diguanylate cyclase (GGDEF)-like protein
MNAEKKSPAQTIVCVDDDLLMLHSLREQLLRGIGYAYEIELAGDGKEALALLDELAAEGREVPLLISDQIMPGMRGTELLQRAHKRYPKMLKVLLTGQADIDAVGQAVNNAGLYRLITKPWQEEDLVLTVKEALRSVAQARELANQALELGESHRQLEMSLALLSATLDATIDGILVVDLEGNPLQSNQQFSDLWQIPPPLLLPGMARELLAYLRTQLRIPDALNLIQGDKDRLPVVAEFNDGRIIEYVRCPQVLNGTRIGMVFSFRDVSEREESAARIRYESSHDHLSGLANRGWFGHELSRVIEHAALTQAHLAVLFIDLDHFKRINDSAGHSVGDELLKAVAQRLSRAVRDGDLVARWGGDEFTALLPDVDDEEDALAVVRRFLDVLMKPFQIGELSLRINASIGMAIFPEDGHDCETLLKHADMALYQVKAEGRNGYRRYHPLGNARKTDAGLTLESELGYALEREQLFLVYQPQIDSRTGRIHGIEALARWCHPQLGMISPEVFITIAEQTGSILSIGEWALETACLQTCIWHEQGLMPPRIAVNLSAMQFSHGDLPQLVRDVLLRTRCRPEWIEMEVTEAVALHNMSSTAAVLQEFQQAGMTVALDDFGTGYASLSYLKELPCNVLKIDRSFIARLAAGTTDAAIVEALVALGTALGLRVVAEGVETLKIREQLNQFGCWIMQGYLYSRPLSGPDMTAMLRAQVKPGRD